METPPGSLGGRRLGIILPVILFFLTMIFILAFFFRNWIGQESWRAHRAYWNDQVTKAAEGVAEEAFAWFLANPDPGVNPVYAWLTTPIYGVAGASEMDLSAQLRYGPMLAPLEVTVVSCTLAVLEAKPFFGQPDLAADFPADRRGQIMPDPLERAALLRVRVELGKRGYNRRYEVVREVKLVNLLPSVIGKFTLFVRHKSPGSDGDANHLRLEGEPGLGLADPSSPLGNPLVVINHPNDAGRIVPFGYSLKAAPESLPEWRTNFDASGRGWVFLGPPRSTGVRPPRTDPFQIWGIHPLSGDVRKARSQPAARSRFYGGAHMLSSFFLLVFRSDQPELASQFPDFTAPPYSNDPGHPFHGVLLVLKRLGFFSGFHPSATDRHTILDRTRNLFSRADGAPRWQLPLHASLVMPMGDIYLRNDSELVDRRSPTLVFGPAFLRFHQFRGNIMQLPGSLKHCSADFSSEIYRYLNSPPYPAVTVAELPYFEFAGGVIQDLPASPVRWAWPAVWGSVIDRAEPGRDFAAVRWNMRDVVSNPEWYQFVMCKVVTTPMMSVFDQMTQDNMRFIASPSSFLPPTHTLTALPQNLVPLDDNGRPTVDDPGTFFYTPTGRGMTADRLALVETGSGRMLARGDLASIWPFSNEAFVPEQASFTFRSFDLRQMATHVVKDGEEFRRRFIRREGNRWWLTLDGGIVVVRSGDVTLRAEDDGPLFYEDGGILVVSDGSLRIRSPIRRGVPSVVAPLTLATANRPGRPAGDIILDIRDQPPLADRERLVEAYLLSSGRLRRRIDSLPGTISGGIAVDTLDFCEHPTDSDRRDSIFAGHPARPDHRSTVIWDAVFDRSQPHVRNQAYRIHLGPAKSYWKTEPI